jgi:hypothetical protein
MRTEMRVIIFTTAINLSRVVTLKKYYSKVGRDYEKHYRLIYLYNISTFLWYYCCLSLIIACNFSYQNRLEMVLNQQCKLSKRILEKKILYDLSKQLHQSLRNGKKESNKDVILHCPNYIFNDCVIWISLNGCVYHYYRYSSFSTNLESSQP